MFHNFVCIFKVKYGSIIHFAIKGNIIFQSSIIGGRTLAPIHILLESDRRCRITLHHILTQ